MILQLTNAGQLNATATAKVIGGVAYQVYPVIMLVNVSDKNGAALEIVGNKNISIKIIFFISRLLPYLPMLLALHQPTNATFR